MIVKGQARKADSNWIVHLQRGDHNEEVRVIEGRDMAATDIPGMIAEMDAYAIGTRCQHPLFDVVVRGPRSLSDIELQRVADLIEERYPGLKSRPRLIIGHTKDGDQHGHLSWARCGPDGPAVNLPWTKIALMDVAISAAQEFDTALPEGMIAERDKTPKPEKDSPSDIPVKLYRQLERMGLPPRDFVTMTRAAWGPDFAATMKKAGWVVAQGDRRGFVLVDHTGAAVGLKQLLPKGLKAADIRAVLGEEEKAPIIEDAVQALQPPEIHATAAFRAATTSRATVETIKLKKAIETKQQQLAAMKEKQARFMDLFRDLAANQLKANAELARLGIEPHCRLSAAQSQKIQIDMVRAKMARDRAPLVDALKKDREELKRKTLRYHAERLAQFARLVLEKAQRQLDAIAARMRPPPSPVKQPLPPALAAAIAKKREPDRDQAKPNPGAEALRENTADMTATPPPVSPQVDPAPLPPAREIIQRGAEESNEKPATKPIFTRPPAPDKGRDRGR